MMKLMAPLSLLICILSTSAIAQQNGTATSDEVRYYRCRGSEAKQLTDCSLLNIRDYIERARKRKEPGLTCIELGGDCNTIADCCSEATYCSTAAGCSLGVKCCN